ncbi:NUDIX hydrolase [bacterium]|nr:NUDIX hydrolase [bacterium]
MHHQAGAIPFRKNEKGEIEVLLVTSAYLGLWIFPKGNIAKGMTEQESALQEALEEAGVTGKISNESIGFYTYTKFDKLYTVSLFPLKVKKILKNWQESSFRERKWAQIPEALNLVENEELKALLSSFADFLKCYPL